MANTSEFQMHLMLLTHYYPPEVNAPASRMSELARAWVAAGVRVTVVTCAPNHPSGVLYTGHRNRWFQREQRDGVEVIRLWTFLAANAGFLLRLFNHLSYPLALLLNLNRLPKADVVLSTSPQFFCGLSGLILKRRRRPWVLEIRDLWPESVVALGVMRRGPIIRVLESIERMAYRKADAVVSVTDSFVPHILSGRGRGPVAVIKNGVDLSFFGGGDAASAGADFRRELGLEGRFVAAYVGTLGMAHGLDIVIAAAERLRDDDRIVFLLVGDGSERARLEAEAAARRLPNLLIIGQRPKADMPAILASTDASLVLLRRLDTFKSVLPSKMFEAMAMRRPMILGVEGESRDLLEAAAAGIAIRPEDADELAAAVLWLADHPEKAKAMGDAGRLHVEEHFDRARLAQRYLTLLREVAADCGRSKGARPDARAA